MNNWYHHDQLEKRVRVSENPQQICTERPTPDTSKMAEYQFNKYLRSRNLDPTLARDNGWYLSNYDFVPRVVIPAVSDIKGHQYWVARDITGIAKVRYDGPQCPRHDAIVVTYPQYYPFRKISAVVVEGSIDALTFSKYGGIGIALLGNSPSNIVLHKLCQTIQHYSESFALVPDKDNIVAFCKIQATLAKQGKYGLVIPFMDAKDFNEGTEEQQRRFVKEVFK